MEIGAFLGEAGIEPAGAPLAFYHEFTEETVKMEPGMPVAEPGEDGGNVKFKQTHTGKVVTALHVGPYEDFQITYAALDKYLSDHGLEMVGPCWEEYLTDPGMEPDPMKWETRIYYPVD